MSDESTVCKKCGEEHRVETYRTLKYYYCPQVNRVMLLSDEVNKDVETQQVPWQLVLTLEDR